jgi:hypothetical protein
LAAAATDAASTVVSFRRRAAGDAGQEVDLAFGLMAWTADLMPW